jgi:glycosyltransferase involved in cell wall biosynthesis
MPERVLRDVASWSKYCPGWELRLWNESALRRCGDALSVPFVRDSLRAKGYGWPADYIRFWALWNYGGVYLDADVEALKSIDHLLDNRAFIGFENPTLVGTAIIGAERCNPCIGALLDHVAAMPFFRSDGSCCGQNNISVVSEILAKKFGVKMDNTLAKYEHITTYPKSVFYPHDDSSVTPEHLFIHRLMCSWQKPLDKSFQTSGFDDLTGMAADGGAPAPEPPSTPEAAPAERKYESIVSVLLPVYNGEAYLKEAIESVLAQTFKDFYLIIVDDGSTDGTEGVAKSFTDERIFYIKNPHRGLVEALNCGLDTATGKYVARMDADDVMLPGRLARQVALMNERPDVAVCGTHVEYIGGDVGAAGSGEWANPVKALEGGNILYHPTVMLRSAFFEAHNLRYPYRLHAEDYGMWLEVARRGGKLYTIPEPLTRYRRHGGQVSALHANVQGEQAKIVAQDARDFTLIRENLTAIIPVCSDYGNAKKTVENLLRTTGWAVNVIIVNDGSADFPAGEYRAMAESLGCGYVEHSERQGVAASRDDGVSACTTPYFLLLDAHMAMYGSGWAQRLIGHLKAHEGDLLSLDTRGLNKEFRFAGVRKMATGVKFSSIYEEKDNWDALSVKWSYDNSRRCEALVEVACAMGGGYAASVASWQRLHGLRGLVKYGADEQYMSLKYRCAGGKVYTVNDIASAHMYKSRTTYPQSTFERVYNQIVIIRTIFDGSMERRLLEECRRMNKNYDECAAAVSEAWVRAEREYLHSVFAPNFRNELKKVYRQLIINN